ncbi:MAG: hypothetical protein AB7L66_07320 [Gemmatimonadales bacterium]
MRRAVGAGLVLAAVAAGCGSGPTGGSETPYDFAFEDPAADTVAATENPDSVAAVDLVAVSGRVDGSRVELTLEFAEPVARWSDHQPNSLDGFVFFDVNQDPGSGFANRLGPRVAGAEFYLDLRDDGLGHVGLVDFTKKVLTALSFRLDGRTLRIEVPRSKLETTSDSDNKLNLRVEVGARGRSPLTDGAANDSVYVLEPPEEP